MRKNGFTMIELLIVITIIAILASILFPIYARSRETARRASCANNLMQIGMALNMYAQNYNGHFPKKNNDLGPLYQYTSNEDIFWCPSDPNRQQWKFKDVKIDTSGRERAVPVKAWSSYVYKGGLINDDRADTPVVSEAMIWHGDVVNILYLDSHVKGRPVEGYKPVVAPTDPPYNGKPLPPGQNTRGNPLPGLPPPSPGG